MAYELKTKKNDASVDAFIAAVESEEKRQDCHTLVAMMQEVTGKPAAMWGPSIIGFDKYSYKYASGHSGEMCLVGFSPRKQNISIYIMAGFDRYDELMSKLGKHKTGKACLYIKRLSDVDVDVLRQLVVESVAVMRANNLA